MSISYIARRFAQNFARLIAKIVPRKENTRLAFMALAAGIYEPPKRYGVRHKFRKVHERTVRYISVSVRRWKYCRESAISPSVIVGWLFTGDLEIFRKGNNSRHIGLELFSLSISLWSLQRRMLERFSIFR